MLAAAAASPPGAAQQTPPITLPQRPADTGKPMVFEAPSRATEDNAKPAFCPVALPCHLEVIGTVQRNGAIELKATAFTW